MAMTVRSTVASALLTMLLASAGAVAADAQVEQARALLREGKPAAAFALLEPQEFERAGDIAFDTVLGIAALDAGRPDKATLAFERVLAMDPNAMGVRLDMARAYFALGDLARARLELDVVMQNNPPPAARMAAEKYLAAIAEREQARRTVVSGYVEGSSGHDDNITSVVSDFTGAVLATYRLPGFQPTGNAIKRNSAIAGLAGGLDIQHRIDDAWSVAGSADLRRREVLDAGNYSSDQLDLRASVARTAGADQLRAGITAQEFRQRTDVPTANRHALGVNVEWRRMHGQSDQSMVFLAATRQRFPDIAVNDQDSVVLGAGWLHLGSGPSRPLLYASLSAGLDDARRQLANGADNSRRFVSGRLYAQASLSETADVFAGVGLLSRRDRSAFARSTVTAFGRDRIADVTLGINWRPAPDWSVRPQLTHASNDSNIALSEYKRTEATITVRRDFR